MTDNNDNATVETQFPPRLQLLTFALVACAITTVYVTQPILPVIQAEFAVNEARASLTISAVIFGIAVSNLPSGMAADRYSVKDLILVGGVVIALCGFLCAATGSMAVLIGARFAQGLFIPCLTTCVAAYLSKTLPAQSLNVAMGSYVSATVVGGLAGRMLGGFVHPAYHWRYAFVILSCMVLVAALAARWLLPKPGDLGTKNEDTIGFGQLLVRPEVARTFVVAFCAFSVFSSLFNYMPFYLSREPFLASTGMITLLYTSYLMGVIVGPFSGKLSNRIGNGATMAIGSVMFGIFSAATMIQSLPVIAASLAGICLSFFAVHSAAAGSLNRKLVASRGRANSLYVLSYYLGGFAGISASGQIYGQLGWSGIVMAGLVVIIVPFSIGVREMIEERRRA